MPTILFSKIKKKYGKTEIQAIGSVFNSELNMLKKLVIEISLLKRGIFFVLEYKSKSKKEEDKNKTLKINIDKKYKRVVKLFFIKTIYRVLLK